jgi:ligand-binding SRPBCC domain-containing protein
LDELFPEEIMPTFQTSYSINAPLKEVAQFHRNSKAMKRLTPPPVFIQIHHAETLAEGSMSEFTMWFGPLPVRWLAVHSGVDPDHGFTDTQLSGPMKFWKHSHHFTSVDENSSRIEELIQYEHHPGIKGLITRLLFSPPGLSWLFLYRKLAINRILKKPSA